MPAYHAIVARRVLTGLVSLLLLSGCGILPGERVCTLRGCESGVGFSLDADLVAETPYKISVCVADLCADGILEVPPPTDGPFTGTANGPIRLAIDTDTIFYSLGRMDVSGEHRVTLTVRGADAQLLAEWDGTPDFEPEQPNGPDCGPPCWLARVRP